MSSQQPNNENVTLSLAILSNAADVLVHEYHRQRSWNRNPATCRACCITIIKLIDNVLRYNDDSNGEMYSKVRRINLSNKVIQQSILSYKGGLEFVLACGFTRMMHTTIGDPNVLILLPDNEDVSHLIKGRQLLQSICIYELHCTISELPLPPPVVPTSEQAPSSVLNTTASDRSKELPGGFNPYQGHRIDTGVPKGQNRYPSSSDYQSPTEMELQRLAAAQAKLEQQVQLPLMTNREWTVLLGSSSAPPSNMSKTGLDAHRTTGDGALLAARAQKLQAERQLRENSGFTTKAMRDVEQMKRARVYSHVQLCIHVPIHHSHENTILQFSGKFLPRETIGHVMDSLIHDCFVSTITRKDFELYITPPKRILSNYDQTLLQEELVPAAKIFCRWTNLKLIPGANEAVQSRWLNELNSSASHSNPNISFPASVPLVSVISASTTTIDDAVTNDKNEDKKKRTALSKEDELLQRMMGGGKGRNPPKKNDVDTPSSKTGNNGTNKPKWFQR